MTRRTAVFVLIAAAFCAVRIALMVKRAPDIDEIFTVWISRKPIASMMATLRLDSGPPLYYALLHAVARVAGLSVTVARVVSLSAAVAAFIVVALSRFAAPVRIAAAALLAVYSQHVFFSVEARAYALTALAVGVAAIALDAWIEMNDLRWLAVSAASIILAAYCHYYGVLLFPVPAAVALVSRSKKQIAAGFAASVACGVAFIPGFMLAAHQPETAIAWMRIDDDVLRVLVTLGSFLRIAFDGRQALSQPWLTTAFQVLSVAAFYIAVARTWTSKRAVRFAIVTIVPIMCATLLAASGRTAYFPIRFESVLSIPVVLWLSTAVEEWNLNTRRALIAANLAIGTIATAALIGHHQPPPTPVRQVATAVRHSMPAGAVPIITSGVSYLEVTNQISGDWRPSVSTYPANQVVHPGRIATDAEMAGDVNRLPPVFLWIGALDGPELRWLAKQHEGRMITRAGNIAAIYMRRRV